MEVTPEITRTAVFPAGIINGLVNDNVLVNVILKLDPLAFRNDQNFPAFDVAVDAGRVNEVNAELVR